MRVETTRLQFLSADGVSLNDVTFDLNGFVHRSRVQNGICILTLAAEGVCLTLSPDLDADVDDLLRLARTHLSEAADRREAGRDRVDVDDSGYLPAGVLADALTLPVRDGGLGLGNWEAVVLLDGRGPASRAIDVTVIGG
jgi:thiamine phosphate synthase YjbQ (UPF0047 family)